MGRRRADVRPRYGRIGVAAVSFGVTALAVLGGLGALPSAADEGPTAAILTAAQDTTAQDSTSQDSDAEQQPASSVPTSGVPATGIPGRADRREAGADPRATTALPARSGAGRRVVFSEGRQRVWLVGRGGAVQRTYLVSGSVYDNLDPGTYAVYSRSEQAWGIDDSGTMKYFVRFTQGDNAAIGFHDIPVDDGHRVQTFDQLGTPQSHGCIRQRRSDAQALWDFAPLGTKVVVTP